MARRTSIPLMRLIPALTVTGLSIACGAAVPPKELVSARTAYDQARSGVAAELAPAKVDTARQALERAESAFQDNAESPETRDLAYMAQLKAQIASAAGEAEAARRKKKEYEEQYAELERKRLNMTQEELEKTRQRLEKERQRAAANEAEIARKDEALSAKEQELARERAARKAAENKLAAAIKSLAEMASVKEEKRGIVVTLSGSVLFATGKYELLPIAKEKLNDVAKALKDQGYKKIVVEGHTDSRGGDENNRELSLKRATSVKDHLISQGIEASKIEAQGLGESRPIASNDTAEGRANNRRVELVVQPE